MANIEMLPTRYPLSCQSTKEEIEREHSRLSSITLLKDMLESYPDAVVVLNKYRQIVAMNKKMEEFSDLKREELLGSRPGDAIFCVNRSIGHSGCGSSQFCQVCGANRAIAQCQLDEKSQVQECRITRNVGAGIESLDLRVWANPIEFFGEKYAIFAVKDITDEKRRKILERIFFHDLINYAGGIRSFFQVLPALSPEEAKEMQELASDMSNHLLDEIEAQRDLCAAERGDLQVKIETVDVLPLLKQLCEVYQHHHVADGKRIAPVRTCGRTVIPTSKVLLGRIIGNLVKNALEASRAGQTVTVSFSNEDCPLFEVHNEECMPEDVQLQMFQRSFTTKGGNGRGLGSYSVRLLTERYLKGQVSFQSNTQQGTRFFIRLPNAK